MYASRDAKEEIPMYRKPDLGAIISFGVIPKKCKKWLFPRIRSSIGGMSLPYVE
jgi:hypothetical protein